MKPTRLLTHMIFILDIVYSKYIEWSPNPTINVHFNTPQCNNSIVLVNDFNTAAVVEEVVGVQSIVLPANGQLTLRQNGSIAFAEGSGDGNQCDKSATRMILNETSTNDWFDPLSWKTSANEATPHAFRLPCSDDIVTLRLGDNPLLALPKHTVQKIAHLKIGAKEFISTKEDFEKLEGLRVLYGFEGENTLTITGLRCQQSTGCPCQDQIPPVNCERIQCRAASCSYPITPVGFCCSICGAEVRFKFDASLNFMRFEKELTKFINVNADNVLKFVGILPDGTLQIVLTEQTYDGASGFLAKLIVREFAHKFKDINGILISGTPDGRRGEPFQIVFTTLAVVVVALLGLYFCYQNPSFKIIPSDRSAFIRFQNRDNSLTGSTTSAEQVNMSAAFGNPLYNSTRSSTASTDLMDDINLSAVKMSELIDQEEI